MNISAKILSYTASDLRDLIIIRKATITRDAELNEIKAYADGDIIWAAVEPLTTGDTRLTGTEPVRSVTYQVVVRYGANIVRDDMIKYGKAVLHITSPIVDVMGRHKYLVFEAVDMREA